MLDWLSTAPREVTPVPLDGAKQPARERPPLRAGYMGHVTLMANKLAELGGQRDAVRDLVSQDAAWLGFAKSELQVCASSAAGFALSALCFLNTGFSKGSNRVAWKVGGLLGRLAPSTAKGLSNGLKWGHAVAFLHCRLSCTSPLLCLHCAPFTNRQALSWGPQERNELEDVAKWACGRPAASELAGSHSDEVDFGDDMHMSDPTAWATSQRYEAGFDDEDDDLEEASHRRRPTLSHDSALSAHAAAAWKLDGQRCRCLQLPKRQDARFSGDLCCSAGEV